MSIDSNPKVWGPVLWKKLHTITFNYPIKIDNTNKDDVAIRDAVRKIFLGLRNTIPCKACRDSYREFIRASPIDSHLGSRENLSYWLYEIHNKVNAKLRNLEREQFKVALQQLDEYARLHRVSPPQYQHMKYRLSCQIKITGPDPSFNEVKRMYKNIRL